MTEQPSVPSEPRTPATFEATTRQFAAPPNGGAQTPGQQLTDSPDGVRGAAVRAVPRARARTRAPSPGGPAQDPYGQAAWYQQYAQHRPEHAVRAESAVRAVRSESAVRAADRPWSAFRPPSVRRPRSVGPNRKKKAGKATLIGSVGLAYLLLAAGTAAAVVAASPRSAPVNVAALTAPTDCASQSGRPRAAPPREHPAADRFRAHAHLNHHGQCERRRPPRRSTLLPAARARRPEFRAGHPGRHHRE